MSDYQAVYDAVRSRFHMPDLSHIIQQQFDISHQVAMIQQAFQNVAYEMERPSVVFKPTLYPDGDMWCALYGEDLQSGCAGFGETPAKAMYDFDRNWNNQKLPSKGDA